MNKFRMKQSVLQMIIPVIVVFLVLPGDLMAKRATQLTVEKIDQKKIEGVLIHVDAVEKSLVLNTDNGGVKIFVNEIDKIRIPRQKSFGRIWGREFLVSVGIGASLGYVLYNDDHRDSDVSRPFIMLAYGCIFGLIGLIGGILSASAARKKPDKEIQVAGSSSKEIVKILRKLKRKALK